MVIMKMLMSLLFAMFLSFNVAFAADNNDKKEAIATEKAATEVVEVKETEKPEGLYCKVITSDGRVISCWVCSCKGLAASVN